MNGKEIIARRVAKMLESGNFVNLGAGLPVMVVDYLPEGVDVILHSENGIVGSGPVVPGQEPSPYEIAAGGTPCSVKIGGAIVDSTTSFGLIRGGHLDVTVLGAMQVDAEGSLANWVVPGGKFTGMGGAMDLVTGAKKVIIATEHCSRDGSPKILEKCTFPLTGYKVVDLIVTELSVIEVTAGGLVVKEIAPGVTVDEVAAKTGAKITVDSNVCTMNLE
ncbi:MAG: 3-oxoacid CoA-transferase subunit B [Candidatus Taylorbacteria bacterium]